MQLRYADNLQPVTLYIYIHIYNYIYIYIVLQHFFYWLTATNGVSFQNKWFNYAFVSEQDQISTEIQ